MLPFTGLRELPVHSVRSMDFVVEILGIAGLGLASARQYWNTYLADLSWPLF